MCSYSVLQSSYSARAAHHLTGLISLTFLWTPLAARRSSLSAVTTSMRSDTAACLGAQACMPLGTWHTDAAWPAPMHAAHTERETDVQRTRACIAHVAERVHLLAAHVLQDPLVSGDARRAGLLVASLRDDHLPGDAWVG